MNVNAKWLLSIAALAAVSLFTAEVVEAKRLGLGRNLGTQRQSVTPPAATPPAAAPSSPTGAASQPVMPAQPGAAAARPAAAPAASGPSRWLGPVAGIAAGLGLAALLSHFGLPEGFASVLLLALLAIGIVFAVRLLMARRGTSPQGIRYAGAGNLPGSVAGREAPSAPAWGGAPKPAGTATAPVVAAPSYAKPLPAGFDATGFAREAKQQFIRIQAAWDSGDRDLLADVMTPDMLAEVSRDLGERTGQRATEVVTLDAEVLEVTTEEGRHWASVRFTGTMREDGAALRTPFDEAWNLTKPVDGSSGWLLAGIQQLA